MNNLTLKKCNVLMVCTRDIPFNPATGRDRIKRFILETLSQVGDVEIFILSNLIENFSIMRGLDTLLLVLISLIKLKPLPIQVLLFFHKKHLKDLEVYIRSNTPDVIYFDGVRAGYYALRLKKKFPHIDCICDFDDLMSRRIEMTSQLRKPIFAGYLKALIPNWIQKYVLDGWLVQFVQCYESKALRSLEQAVGLVSRHVILLSKDDAKDYHMRTSLRSIVVIPPPVKMVHEFYSLTYINRFIFIGSDVLLQNKLTIDYLINLWKLNYPEIDLYIYGKQTAHYEKVPRVKFIGFIEDISDAYQSGCIMLTPSFIGGGVKTKVLEAISYGVLTIGNIKTFEGIQADCSKLSLSDEELISLVTQPEEWISIFNSVGLSVYEQVMKSHRYDYIRHQWIKTVWPSYDKIPNTALE